MIRAMLAFVPLLGLAGCEPARNAPPGDEAGATPPGGEIQGQRWPPDGSTGPMPTGEVTASLEPDVDRPGYDLRRIEGLAAPEQCRQACLDDNLCHAFTWIRPGAQGPQSQCWIKTDVGAPRADECCVSGVVEGRPFDPH